MQPSYNRKWEHTNRLIFRRYLNDFCNLQFHAQIELYFVDEGEMEFTVGGHHAFLKDRQLSVALSYVPHAYKTPAASRSSALFIPPHLCEKFITMMDGKRLATPFITDEGVYEEIRRYYDALKQAEGHPLLEQGYLYVILGIIHDHCKPEPYALSPNVDLLTKILTQIEAHCAEELTPAALCARLGYSHSYLARFFKAQCGVTLGQYIIAVKLKRALSILQEEKTSVTDCALESGFSSVSSFYRCFRKEFNCSPSEYMKMVHQ